MSAARSGSDRDRIAVAGMDGPDVRVLGEDGAANLYAHPKGDSFDATTHRF
jgi:hypothetical protein